MRISDWSSDVCSSDLQRGLDRLSLLCRATSHGEHAEVGPLANLLLPHDLDSRGGTGDQMDSDLDAALNDPAERLNRLAEPRLICEEDASMGLTGKKRCPDSLVGSGVHRISDERRVRKECVSTCRSRWSADN